MLRGPTVRDDGTGEAVLVKHAIGAERLRLHHEAQILAAARMDGVVECVGLDEFDQRCELRLRYIEATTLDQLPPMRAHDALDVLIRLGATLADLHARGIRHGAFRNDHILLAQPNRPVLCGFGEATSPDDRTQHPPSADLAALAALATAELTRSHTAAVDSADRYRCAEALIACDNLAAAAPTAQNSSEPLTAWLAHLQHIRDAPAREPAEAHGAFSHVPSPPAAFTHDPHGLRERLRTDDTDAALPAAHADTGQPHDIERSAPPLPNRRRVAMSAAIFAALAIAAFVGWQALTGGTPNDAGPADLIGTAAIPRATTAPVPEATPAIHDAQPTAPDDDAAADGGIRLINEHEGRTGATDAEHNADAPQAPVPEGATLLYSTSSPGCPEPTELESHPNPDSNTVDADATDPDQATAVHRADIRGNGCPEPVYIEAPNDHSAAAAVRTSHGKWTVGAPGDLVTVGDWNCDGRATLAGVNPSTGTVSFFASWPHSQHPVMPTHIAHVPHHATAVSPVPSAEAPSSDTSPNEISPLTCDELIVHYGELSLTLSQLERTADTTSWLATKQR